MKLIVTGYARHGKDTVCALLRDRYGLSFKSSSEFVAERAVRPYLQARGLEYDTLAELYADRINHRKAWFDAISAYNAEDAARLGRELFEEYDIYCGLRSIREFVALHRYNIFDVSIWVNAAPRIWEAEDKTSMTIHRRLCDFELDNGGSLEELDLNLEYTIRAAARFCIARSGPIVEDSLWRLAYPEQSGEFPP